MKQHNIITNASLTTIIRNLTNESFSIEIDNINNLVISNSKYPDIIIKIIENDINSDILKEVIDHYKIIEKSSDKTHNKILIESTAFDYIVFVKQPNGDIIYNANLLELVLSNVDDNIYNLNDPVWNLYENVPDDWIPMIEEKVKDMDIPVDPIDKDSPIYNKEIL